MISFELLTDLENTFYEFETLLHCFNDCSLLYHIVRAQNVPPPFGPYAGAKTHSLAIALLTALCPTVPQLCGLVIGARVAGQGSKYVIMFI